MIEDALKNLTRRQLEQLRDKIDDELRRCTLCGTEGASLFQVVRVGTSTRASMLFCKPCFEKHRLPDGRWNSKLLGGKTIDHQPSEGVEGSSGDSSVDQ